MKGYYLEWTIQFALRSKCKHIIHRRNRKIIFEILNFWIDKSYKQQINRRAIVHYHNTFS